MDTPNFFCDVVWGPTAPMLICVDRSTGSAIRIASGTMAEMAGTVAELARGSAVTVEVVGLGRAFAEALADQGVEVTMVRLQLVGKLPARQPA